MTHRTTLVPTESAEQQALFQWARLSEGRYPELRLLHHIPNGGLRNKPVAVRLTAEGVRRGIPDICLPVARGGFHGLYIELKRTYGGVLSEDQRAWLDALRAGGYCAMRCDGADQARDAIVAYLSEVFHIERKEDVHKDA